MRDELRTLLTTRLFPTVLPQALRHEIASRVNLVRILALFTVIVSQVVAIAMSGSPVMLFGLAFSLPLLADALHQRRGRPRPLWMLTTDATAVLVGVEVFGVDLSVAGLGYAVYVVLGLLLLSERSRWPYFWYASAVFTLTANIDFELIPMTEAAQIGVSTAVSGALLLIALSVVDDVISVLKARADEVDATNARLSADAQRRDKLISSLGHELRTPLTGVIGFGSELHERWNSFEEETRRDLARLIAQQGALASEIAENLLVAGRADVGLLTLRLDRTSLSDVANEAARSIDWLRGSSTPVFAHSDVEVYVDRQRAVKALKNLIMNAYDHGGPNVWVETYEDGRVAVIDDGPEAPASDLNEMLQPYSVSREESQPSAVGVGLNVTRSLVELMGGTLSFDRREDTTVFEVLLPTVIGTNAPLQDA